MHFYPGVAEYQDDKGGAQRVFLNENTIRAMDPSFAGRPVFVHHVDGVEESVDILRAEADGWVIQSFYNEADGKHWVKFLVCSEKGEAAVKAGMQLSNCYVPNNFGQGGLWNGVSYSKEITGGEYEHLAIVPNPRYEESVIMTPEAFKRYNETKKIELLRLANSKKEHPFMKLNFFKRAKVENSADLDGMLVILPKSGKEASLLELIQNADDAEEKKKEGGAIMADPSHHVDMSGVKVPVGDLVKAHKQVCDELASMKGDKEREGEEDESSGDDEDTSKKKNDEDDKAENSEEEDEDDKAKKKKNEADDAAAAAAATLATDKKATAKRKADAVRNAASRVDLEEAQVHFSQDQVARGKSRYGSN